MVPAMSHRFPHLDRGLTWCEPVYWNEKFIPFTNPQAHRVGAKKSCFLITHHNLPWYVVYYFLKSRKTQQLFFTPYLHLHHSSPSATWISKTCCICFWLQCVILICQNEVVFDPPLCTPFSSAPLKTHNQNKTLLSTAPPSQSPPCSN